MSINTLPKWYLITVNSYVLDNYRKPTSFTNCFLSLFIIHNETFNIYSHLLPSFYFIYNLYSVLNKHYYTHALIQYKCCILFGYYATIFMCISSSFAHTFYIIDSNWSDFVWKLDFIGIILINLSHQIFDIILLSKFLGYYFLYFNILSIFFALYCIFSIYTGNLEIRRFWGITYPIASSTILTIPTYLLSQYNSNIILRNASYGSIKCSIIVFISGLFFFKGKFPEKYFNPYNIFNNFNSHTFHHILIISSILSCFESIPVLYLLI
jgi:adiponectin receptor